MQFKPKNFNEIVSSMATNISRKCSKLTYFYVGGVMRTLIEAISSEISLIYLKITRAFPEIIQNSVLQAFGFSKTQPKRATGIVTIEFVTSLTQKVQIPAGTRFYTDIRDEEILYFESTSSTEALYGTDSIDIPVRCTVEGTVGNIDSMKITNCNTPFPFMKRVYNTLPIIGGSDEESIENTRKRFSDYIETLAKGTTKSIEYGCSTIEEIKGVYIEEKVGYINVYAHDQNGNLPDSLKDKLLKEIDKYRCAGIEVVIKPVMVVTIDVSVTVTIAERNFNANHYRTLVENSITSYLSFFSVSRNLIKSDLIRNIMNIDNSISNVYVDMESDVIILNNQIIRPGTITVNIL